MDEETINPFGRGMLVGVLLMGVVSIILGVLMFGNVATYKEILLTDTKVMDMSTFDQEATSYYTEASFAYEQQDWSDVESNCRLAREKYSAHAQGIRTIREEIDSESKIMTIYKDMLTEQVNIDNNMYEACEHFESASRYYAKYYSNTTPIDDSSYDMGTGEIEMMNDKIKEHDIAVERYNDLLAQYSAELSRLTK